MDPVGGEFSFRLLAGNLGGLIFECVAEFVRRYGLKENHLCDFFYFGKNTFIVKILDGTLKEISYGVGTSLSQPIVIDEGDEEAVDDEDPVGDDEDAEEDEEDDGIMEVSEGEEENGVNRVLHPFDKVITKSDSKGDQTLVSSKIDEEVYKSSFCSNESFKFNPIMYFLFFAVTTHDVCSEPC